MHTSMNKNLSLFQREHSPQTALLLDYLTGALIGLARASDGNADLLTPETDALLQRGLLARSADEGPDAEALQTLLEQVHAEKARLVPDCAVCQNPCGHNDDYSMAKLWNAPEDIRSLKCRILSRICEMAAYTSRAAALGCRDEDANRFFYKALFILGEDAAPEHLLAVALQADEETQKVRAALNALQP